MEKDNSIQKYFFVYLPYLNMGQTAEIDFGFAKIWNFDLKQKEYLSDANLLQMVNKILANHKTSYGKVRGIGLGLVGDNDFRKLSEFDFIKINDARLILFISFLSEVNTITRNMNTGHSMVSSENFEMINFSIVLESEYMTEYTGFVVPSWHGGIKINENIKTRERHILTPSHFRFDKELFNSLIELRTKKPKIFRRIISAVGVFYESYYNASQISHTARILLQASAFETLFKTKEGKGRKELKDNIKKYANYKEDKIIEYKAEGKNPSEIKIEFGTIKEKWADRFFTLRNHIMHGLIPKPREYLFGKWQRHFDVALYFFIFFIKREIEKSLRKEIFGDDVVYKTWTDDLMEKPQKFTGFEYDSFGRRAWERMMKKIHKKKTN